MEGYEEKEIKSDDVRCDEERDGVWVGSDILLPRNVVVWAFQALAEGDEK